MTARQAVRGMPQEREVPAVIDRVDSYYSLMQLLKDCRLGLCVTTAARLLGYDSPAEFNSWLRRCGLPPFSLLRNWVYVVHLLRQDARGLALAH